MWTSRIDTWWPRDHTVHQAVADGSYPIADVRAAGLSYRVSRSPDGASLEHVAVVDGEPNIAERVVGPPHVRSGAVVARFS